MTASVRARPEGFADAYLLPAGAVFGKAGQSYILVVEGGVDEGRAGGRPGERRQAGEGGRGDAGRRPAGDAEPDRAELIVAARQLEVGEGTRVSPVFENPGHPGRTPRPIGPDARRHR